MKKRANQSIAIDISSKSCSDDEVILWAEALEALKQVKLDEVATKTTFESCKYCKFPKSTKAFDCDETDDLKQLNTWKSTSKAKEQKLAEDEIRKREAAKARQLRMLELERKKKAAEEKGIKEIVKRDNYNFAPRALSLLGINVDEFMKKPYSEQLRLIQEKQEQYGKVDTDHHDHTVECCVKKLLLLISNIQNGNFTVAEKTEKITNLLNQLERKQCFRVRDPTHCDCLLKQLDIPKLKETAKLSTYIKSLIMDNFNKALDRKLGEEFGLISSEIRDEATEITPDFLGNKPEPEACCPDRTCLCPKVVKTKSNISLRKI